MPTQPSNSIPQITFPTLQPTPRPTPQPVPQPTPQPSPRPTQPPQGSGTSVQFVGNNEVPASAFPLGLCEGGKYTW